MSARSATRASKDGCGPALAMASPAEHGGGRQSHHRYRCYNTSIRWVRRSSGDETSPESQQAAQLCAKAKCAVCASLRLLDYLSCCIASLFPPPTLAKPALCPTHLQHIIV